jgi:hypothetical protein
MTNSTKLRLLGIVMIALWVFCYRFGAIGVRGGSVSRDESPRVYWFGMGALGLAIVLCFVVAVWSSN